MSDTHIKINAVTPRVQYTGNGVTTTFPYEFAIFDETDMVVYVGDDIIESGYTVTGAGETEGGTVVFDTAPDDGAKITLLRNVPIERVTDFQEGGTFRPKNLNDEFDRQTAFVQQVQESLTRCVKVDPTSSTNPEEILPKVEELYDDIENIDKVADSILNVDTVADDIANVNTCAGAIASIIDAPNQATYASNSAAAAAASASSAAISAAGTHFKLFQHGWFDYQLNDMAWLRADTFSWQDGTVYTDAYNHLVNELPSKRTFYGWISGNPLDQDSYYTLSATPQAGDIIYKGTTPTGTPPHYTVGVPYATVASYSSGTITDTDSGTYLVNGTPQETQQLSAPDVDVIAGHSIWYELAADGHKIVHAANASAVEGLYNDTGVAWYYILDLVNQKFKLPRTKYGFTGLRDTVGKYVSESLPNIKGEGYAVNENSTLSGAFYDKKINATHTSGSFSLGEGKFDASRVSSAYQDNSPVQQRATQMYLYFYVGQFSQTATEQTAGLNASLFNGKADVDLSNAVSNASASAKSTIVGWGMPDYTSIVTRSENVEYTETTNGFLIVCVTNISGDGQFAITIDGLSFSFYQGYAGTDFSHPSVGFIPIPASVSYTITKLSNTLDVWYVPCIGG